MFLLKLSKVVISSFIPFENKWFITKGRLDLAVLYTLFAPNWQNRNQVDMNNCAGVLQSTPSSEEVWSETVKEPVLKQYSR